MCISEVGGGVSRKGVVPSETLNTSRNQPAIIDGMGKKSDAAEIDRRIHTVVKMLASAKTSSYVIRFCSEEWGVGQRMAEKYLARARWSNQP